MLVLGRKTGETIVIAGKIKLHVVGFRGRTVRLGIDAPDDISIERLELAERREALQLVDDLMTQHAGDVKPIEASFAGSGRPECVSSRQVAAP